MDNFNNYLFRSSSLGKLMTTSRTKGELSQTTKSYLNQILREEIFGFNYEFSSKYTDKGNLAENKAIELFSSVTGYEFDKNEKNFINEFISGTPDIVSSIIIDIKSSWDEETFPMNDDKLKNKMYYWQVMGYMWLTDLQMSEIAYCLVDTPEIIVNDEIRRESWKNKEITPSEDMEEFVKDKLTFSDKMHPCLRVKKFPVKRDENDIEKIKERVVESRKYLNNMLENMKVKISNFEKNKVK